MSEKDSIQGDTIIQKIIKEYLRDHSPAQVLEDQAQVKAQQDQDEQGGPLVDQVGVLEKD